MRIQAATRFTLMLLALLTALVGVQVIGLTAQRSADRSADSRVQLARDVEQIRYYDELLTMSARLAAASGDTSYVERYQQAVPKLDRVIGEAMSVVPDRAADDAVRATDQANQALIALEEDSFRRLAAGDRAGAYAYVTSTRYARLKAEYRQGMDVAVERLQLASARQRARATRRQQLGLAAGVGAAALLALLSAATARGLHRSQRARSRVEEQLRVQAYADPLTGLANRRLFREHLATALATADPGELAVLFADLDHFKTVNDTRGHAAGDAMLVEVAERVIDLLHGHNGALLARMGGDEFAVLLPSTDARAAEQLADRMVAALARPYAAAPLVPVTASVGLAVTAAKERDPGVLLRGADLAMYDAKSGGRGRWSRYAEHMHSDLLARVELESQLREGIPRGELVVHYQPTQNLRTGRQHGVEALVRWQHPQRGLLPPSAFVPLAERSDVITELGRFVLEQACRQLAAWRAELGDAAPTEVAANVSPRELAQHGYPAHVLAVLHLTGLPASCLVLEVTESAVMTEKSGVIEVLTDLRAAGVRIAIDDFGTGHSSLARLHELPVDTLKIDRSFVHAAAPDDTTPGDTSMLDLIVALAAHLRLDLVAEGIETPRQLAAVRDAGCAYGQGYLLGRPQPADPSADNVTSSGHELPQQ
ncbi:MAG TPA: bifunctional diguanylate cyclase/phosphodiesterase, partial [Kineosporiaceae bacterium]|nr:bifunctional diguanylate cyclase/phosphodiesterase [Kineosporiaceae bacterium]